MELINFINLFCANNDFMPDYLATEGNRVIVVYCDEESYFESQRFCRRIDTSFINSPAIWKDISFDWHYNGRYIMYSFTNKSRFTKGGK